MPVLLLDAADGGCGEVVEVEAVEVHCRLPEAHFAHGRDGNGGNDLAGHG